MDFQPVHPLNNVPSPPPSLVDMRPSINRSKSQQVLVDSSRPFNTINTISRSHDELMVGGNAVMRPPASMPAARGQKLSATVKGMATATIATLPRVHHAVEDINLWSNLYSQRPVHTRQDYQRTQDSTATLALATPSEGDNKESHGQVKVRQVLTKTVLDDTCSPHQHPRLHFERLPIKVQTSASALSPHGRPFSIVFFFTVELAPVTLWYLESAFTQSRTVHERMEPMGTFQPNDLDDPASFYIYETHAFNIVQPTREDTMLDLRVQSPTGTIYAEFSYTFVKEHKRNRTTSSNVASLTSPLSPIDSTHSQDNVAVPGHLQVHDQPASVLSPHLEPPSQDIYTLRDTADRSQHLNQSQQPDHSALYLIEEIQANCHSIQSSVQSSSIAPDASMSSTQTSIPTLVRSHLEDDDSGEEDDSDELFVENYTEEPDAGEHFMQATSEFFSKMGYWLYNSRVVQYIARDDRSRTKTVFQNDDIWILGVCYSFEGTETSITLPESSRSRKGSTIQAHGALGLLNGQGGLDTTLDSSQRVDSQKLHIVSPVRSTTDSDALSGCSDPTAQRSELDHGRSRSKERLRELKQKEKELLKAKKIARAKERELEKEQARAQEKAKAQEKARLKEREKLQKLKAKISLPQFDEKNLRTGVMDLRPVQTSGEKESGQILEPDRKSRSIHGYPRDGASIHDAALLTEDDASQSVIRRMRSISILPKVSNAVDLKTHKKGDNTNTDRVYQARSKSVSNVSAVSQRSTGTSSTASYEGSVMQRSSSPPPPENIEGMNMHEALAGGPKSTIVSKLFHQKQVPDLPALNDMPDIPVYRHQDDDLSVSAGIEDQVEPSTPTFPAKDFVEDASTSASSSPRSGRRRTTISGIFSKDAKPESSGGMAALKAFVTVNKPSSSSSSHRLSLLPQSNKGGVTKNVQHWLERRLSSHNLHQQVFVASTDEPVPPFRDTAHFSPPASPLQNTSPRQEETSKKVRSRKKSSIFSSASSSSAASSPKSALKSGSPQSPSLNTIPMMPDALDWQAELPDARDPLGKAVRPTLQHMDSSVVLVEDRLVKSFSLEPSPLTPSIGQSPHAESNSGWIGNLQDNSSFKDLVILPPLPPESPSEAFVLLDQGENASIVSLERGPEDSLLISMPGEDTAPETRPTQGVIQPQSSRTDEHVTLLVNEKDKGQAGLRSDWEALSPTKEAEQGASIDASQYVLVKEAKSQKQFVSLKPEELSFEERERIRKIGSAYVKVKDPKLDLVAPQPKVPVMIPGGEEVEDPPESILRTASPDRSIAAPPPPLEGDQPPKRKQRLLQLPSALLTSLPRQASPSSPSSSLSKSWKNIAPRSLSPRTTSPLMSSSTSASPRSVSAHPTCVEATKTDMDMENTKQLASPAPRTDVILVPTSDKHLIPDIHGQRIKPSSNQLTLLRFMLDFQSRLWFTYRKDMARLEPSFYTSDAGWGCMMRTGQSLLAQAFIQIQLGRDWRIRPAPAEDSVQRYHTILGWFADEPERYYSIHNIAKSGLALDKRIGEWFGPSTVAHALRRLSQRHVDCPVTVMAPMDNTVYVSEILSHAFNASGQLGGGHLTPTMYATLDNKKWKPIVLLLPARYGLDKLTERYVKNLKELFKLPQFLGIAGGRPGRSLYFVACQGNELFYFDPHFVKPRATQDDLKQCPSPSYHCGVVRTMDILELDPSMMLGFLIQSLEDLTDLGRRLKQDMEKAYPLLTIQGDIPGPQLFSN
ncbi:Cysteine protease atg4b [Mortierella sp. GBA30]|nr:Cysteine protease atg4b [Mortierella sp. GBA30]